MTENSESLHFVSRRMSSLHQQRRHLEAKGCKWHLQKNKSMQRNYLHLMSVLWFYALWANRGGRSPNVLWKPERNPHMHMMPCARIFGFKKFMPVFLQGLWSSVGIFCQYAGIFKEKYWKSSDNAKFFPQH